MGRQLAELVGGPVDGQRRELKDGPLPPLLEYSEPDRRPHPGGSIGERLLAGETIPASEVENEGLIIHVYRLAQPTRRINKAWVYRYEGVAK